MSAVLAVRALRKSFGGVVALAGVDFDLGEGEILAMIGPNGAGKSTCFNIVNGQLRPDAGSVRLMGRELIGLGARRIWRLGVGRTFQITATFGSMTVLENVQMALLSAHGRLSALIPRAGRLYTDEGLALLALVGLADLADRPCSVLAYGDLKRAEFAIALAHRPRLLLMDEPTAGMAAAERIALMRLVADIVRARGISVLFTEHDMDVVFGHASRIIVLNRGELIASGSPDAVRADAAVRAIYLGTGGLAPRRREHPG
jgi:branched-chain amino acid transport system ATP-binding protein